MYHFFVEEEQISGQEIFVAGPDVNHIRNVLRMRPGERVLLSSRGGGDYLCELRELLPKQVRMAILTKQESSMELPARIHLFQGLPKSDRMELIIQKAVELGVFRVIPVETKRVIVRLDAKKVQSRVRRWQAISESAAKQSRRSIVPRVEAVMAYEDALKEAAGYGLKLIPYEGAEGMGRTRELLKRAEPGSDIAVFIGPEGGFEEEEIRRAMEAGTEPITLGRRILRTETAGLCILSALMLSLEDF